MSPLTLPPASWAQVQLEERYRSNATMGVTSWSLCGASARLAPVMGMEAAPWLADALEELRALKAAGKDMPGLGDFRLTDETADRARKLLTLEPVRRLPAPTIVPFSGGGLALNWGAKGYDLSLSVYPDREVTFIRTTQNDAVAEDGSLTQDSELAKIVDRFLVSLI
jgi:hypothetical protein